jgi:hypothetical protein
MLVSTFTRQQIENFKVGDLLPNCFGEMKPITKINHKGYDVNGKLFITFYQQFGETSQMSNSIKEDREFNIS